MVKNSPTPRPHTVSGSKAAQLGEQLLADLRQGRFAAGQMLPPEFELAERYDVSRSTVRRVVEWLVNDGHLIKQPQRGAMVPDSRRDTPHNQVAWVTTGLSENVVEYGRGLQNAIALDHYMLGAYCSHADFGLYHKLIDQAVAMRPAGIVLQGAGLHRSHRPSPPPRTLVESGIPVVVIGGDDHLDLPCDRVFTSRAYAARKTADYLITKNYRDLALVTLLPPELQKPMIAELRNTLGTAGITLPEKRIFHFETPRGWTQPPNPYIDTQEQMARLLADGFRCGTVVVDHDYPAVGVLRALLAAGLRVPQDVQVLSMSKCQVEGVSPLHPDHHRPPALRCRLLRRRTATAPPGRVRRRPPKSTTSTPAR